MIRRLAAIMFTDIVDYSRLMNQDETKAMKLLENYDSIGEKCFNKYNGRLIKKIGDADFVEFPSALDAVNCAIQLQKVLKERNASLTNKFDIIHIRIGIHVGDVIEKDQDIFGDGVNIASRIVSVAGGGEICISKEANASIQGQKGIVSASIGEHTLKNIIEKWGLYRIFINEKEYSKWAEENYRKQVSLKKKTTTLKKYIVSFIIILFTLINVPIARHYYYDYTKKASINKFFKDVEIVLSSTDYYKDKISIIKKPKDVYLSIPLKEVFEQFSQDLKAEKDIGPLLKLIIGLMNRFDGLVEISTHSALGPVPIKVRDNWKTDSHLSGARSATLLEYFMDNDLQANKIKFKNQLWGHYKPYKYIDSEIIPSNEQIKEANFGKNRREQNKKQSKNNRFDIRFYYD